MLILRGLILIGILLSSFCGYSAERENIDSLKKLYNQTDIDSVKILTSFKIIKAFDYNIDSARFWLDDTEKLILRSSNDNYRAEKLILEGHCIKQSGDMPLAMKKFQEAIDILEPSGPSSLLFDGFQGVIDSYMDLGDSKTALDQSYILEEKILLAQGNFGNELARLYVNIGIIFKREANFDYALDYFNKSLSICDSLSLLSRRNTVLNNLGGLYQTMGDFETAKNYHFEALEWNLENGDRAASGKSYGNLALIYIEEGNDAKAVEYMLKAQRIFIEINNWQSQLLSHQFLGNIYLTTDSLKKAEVQFNAAKKMCQERDQMFIYVDVLASLSELHERKGNHKLAIELLREEKVIRDSIDAEQLDIELVELKLKYEEKQKAFQDSLKLEEQKKSELMKQESEADKKNSQLLITILSSVTLVILILFAIVLLKRRREKG